jgi:hypothetical protein
VYREIWLAYVRKIYTGSEPIHEVVRYLGTMNRDIVLRRPYGSLDVLGHRDEDDMTRDLFHKWIDPTGFPRDADFISLAALLPSYIDDPAAYRHVAAMLSNRTAIGFVEVREHSFKIGDENIEARSTEAKDLPQVGTKVPIRVCDDYAYHLVQQGGPPIVLWASESQRDAAVLATQRWLPSRL